MTRIASLLAIPLAVVLVLGMASGADARGKYNKHKKPPQTCETRIFQGEEAACFEFDGRSTLARKKMVDTLADTEEQDGGFTVLGAACGCQLLRRYDFICADSKEAFIGSVDRRGRWVRGEALSENGEQVKFIAKRLDLEVCEAANQ